MNDNQKQLDAEHLRLLSIFHYVVGGLGILSTVLPLAYLAFGAFIFAGRLPDESNPADMRWFGMLMVMLGGFMLAMGLAASACLILAGRYLAERRHRMFCLVVAAVMCAFAPLGTVLGVFTIIVLSRASVREVFEPVPRAAGASD